MNKLCKNLVTYEVGDPFDCAHGKLFALAKTAWALGWSLGFAQLGENVSTFSKVVTL